MRNRRLQEFSPAWLYTTARQAFEEQRLAGLRPYAEATPLLSQIGSAGGKQADTTTQSQSPLQTALGVGMMGAFPRDGDAAGVVRRDNDAPRILAYLASTSYGEVIEGETMRDATPEEYARAFAAGILRGLLGSDGAL